MKTEKNILIAFLLNLTFSCFEFFGGLFTNSIAILSDSIHDLGDALSIGISYFLERKSKKKPDEKFTYGYIRYSVLGSIITALILLLGSIFVIYESIERIINPVDINYNSMIIFAVFGVIVNFIAAYFTREGNSLNQKSVNLHMLEDVLGWIVVLIGSILIKFTDILYIDSILSIGVAIYVFINAFKNLKSVTDLFLEKMPDNISVDEIKEHILKIQSVIDIHHIHIRSIDGYYNIATFHAVVSEYSEKIKSKIKEELKEHGINHSTIEFELESNVCDERNCKVDFSNISAHYHGVSIDI